MRTATCADGERTRRPIRRLCRRQLATRTTLYASVLTQSGCTRAAGASSESLHRKSGRGILHGRRLGPLATLSHSRSQSPADSSEVAAGRYTTG